MRLQVGKGIEKYISQLGNLNMDAPETIRKAVYEGAGIVADQVKANIRNMPVQDTYAERITGIKSIQKKGLEVSFGIASARNDNGYVNVKLGFDGYNRLTSKKYPQGQPNAMIARTFEGGNSFTKKIPFVAPAVRATKDKAEKRMAEVIDREIKKDMK